MNESQIRRPYRKVLTVTSQTLFGGSLFDSFESLIADNVQYDDERLKKLKDKERELKRGKDFVCHLLNMISAKQQKTDLTSEHAEILPYRVKWFKRQGNL